MKILAIDTSGASASAAIADGADLVCEYTLKHGITHSRTLMPMVDKVLADAELDIADIDLFAVSAGPGSFTGIRIGVAAAKGFAYALKKPLIGINTLEAIAAGLYTPDCIVVPIIDARNENVYAAAYSYTDTMNAVFEPCAVTIGEIAEQCGAFERVIFVGDGAHKYRDILSAKLGEVHIAPEYMSVPSAAAIAARAYAVYDETQEYPTAAVKPIYLKKSQAERELDEKRAKAQAVSD